jgi:uncharacterized protein
MRLDQKTILITGAASGIGACLLKELCQYEAQIVCADIQQVALEKTVQQLGATRAKIELFVGDLTQQVTVDRLFAFAMEKTGRIDVFIANAGFAYYEKLDKSDWEHIEKIYRLNVFSPIYSAQKMAEMNVTSPYCVVLIASAMSYIAVPGYSLYSSTKSAIDRFAEGYRFDMPTNGHLMVVYPVGTRTNFFNHAGKNVPTMPPSQTPEFVAKAIVRGLLGDKRKVYPSYIFRFGRFSAITLQLMRLNTYLIGNRQLQNWLKNR